MRKIFHSGLDQVMEQVVEMTGLVNASMAQATTALLNADLSLAESVITIDEDIAELRKEIDASAIQMMALQQPVATDLRTLVTAVQMTSLIERMGDLARHVAKITRLRYPDSAVPTELHGLLTQMGEQAVAIVARAGEIISTSDAEAALTLEQDDDAMDDLQRDMLSLILGEDWPHGREAAVDLALLARYYERYADHAVSVAGRVAYLVTGEWIDEAHTDHEDIEDRMQTATLQ